MQTRHFRSEVRKSHPAIIEELIKSLAFCSLGTPDRDTAYGILDYWFAP